LHICIWQSEECKRKQNRFVAELVVFFGVFAQCEPPL
jgi:hypothetical protein